MPLAAGTTTPAHDRPSALDRFAQRVLGSPGNRGRERPGMDAGTIDVGAVDAASLGEVGGGDRLEGADAMATNAIQASDLPAPFLRIAPAVQRDASAGAASLVQAVDVAVGTRLDGVMGRAIEATDADGRRAGADPAESQRGSDAAPGFRAPAAPAIPDIVPAPAIQRSPSGVDGSGHAPVRLSVGQVRRLGLGAPLASDSLSPSGVGGPGRFGAPAPDLTGTSAGAVPTAPTTLPMPRVQRSSAGNGGQPPEDPTAAADAAYPWVRRNVGVGQIEAGAAAGPGLAPGGYPAAGQPAAAPAIDAVMPLPAVMGVPIPAPWTGHREAGELRPLVGRRPLGRGRSGPTANISVSRLADADVTPPGGGPDFGPLARGGFDAGANSELGPVPSPAWAGADGARTFSLIPEIPSWTGLPGLASESGRRSASTSPGDARAALRASPASAGPAPAAALQREWAPSGSALPWPPSSEPAASPGATSIQLDPEPASNGEPAVSPTPGSFEMDVVQRAMGASASGGASGSLPTGDRELELLAESLYERVRSHLRQELLVDRERAGILSNLS